MSPAESPQPPATVGPLRVDVESHLHDDFPGSDPEEELPDDHADQIRRAVTAAARHRGFRAGTIEVAIVDDRRIHAVNRQHLAHDWETDVISFPYGAEAEHVEGELVISWETARREARRAGWPAMTELVLYAIHGTLHLAGMDDQSPDERREMRQAEQAVLAMLRPAGYQRYDVDRESTRGENADAEDRS